MNDYKKLLDEAYKQTIAWDNCCHNKLQFLGSHMFDMTTYDGYMDEVFAIIILRGLENILNRTTFDYIDKSTTNYFNYMIAINHGFVHQMLGWGMSIRGAWLDEYREAPYELFDNYQMKIIVPPSDINAFVSDLIEWSEYKIHE